MSREASFLSATASLREPPTLECGGNAWLRQGHERVPGTLSNSGGLLQHPWLVWGVRGNERRRALEIDRWHRSPFEELAGGVRGRHVVSPGENQHQHEGAQSKKKYKTKKTGGRQARPSKSEGRDKVPRSDQGESQSPGDVGFFVRYPINPASIRREHEHAGRTEPAGTVVLEMQGRDAKVRSASGRLLRVIG